MTGSARPDPAIIGPYRVLSRLGEGGMGEVFLAERKDIGQRVALKLIKLGMDTRAILARFEAERQALARMQHSHIAKVLDAGATPEGRPYFVMEYVKGAPITRYCDDHKLSVEDRLALFQQVCSGVQHAHSKGVIHRDLTPNNVLVTVQDGKATAKIIDFGLARAADHRLTEMTVFTEQGTIMGTPEYMSPEQAGLASLDIDTRTDVYTLGVMLYELLTGELPFSREELRRAGYDGMCKTIREKEPDKPSTRITKSGTAKVAQLRRTESDRLLKRLRGDLDWVVLKCLEKDRTRRYETPTHLADDLQRHLDDEVVVARAPTAGYRLRKLARRYRGQLAAAAVVLLAVVAGLIGTTTFWLEAREQARVARERAAEAETRREDAERERAAKGVALAATERALHRGTGMRLVAQATLLATSNPGLAVALADAGGARVAGPEAERALRASLAVSREVATTYLWEEEAEGDAPIVLVSTDLGIVVRLDHPAAGAVTAWALSRGAPPRRTVVQVGDVELARDAARHVALAPDGRFLAIVAPEAVRVYRTDSGAVTRRLALDGREVSALTFDHRSAQLVIAWRSGPLTATSVVTDAAESTLVEDTGPEVRISCAAAAPRLLLRDGERFDVVDLERHERVASFEVPVGSDMLSADGTRAIAWDGWSARVVTWDAARGRWEATDPSQRVLSDAECWSASPDGRRLALGCALGVLKVWDLDAQGTVQNIESRDGDLTALAFDADGRRLATGAGNGVVRVLAGASWAETLSLLGHAGRVLVVRFVGDTELVSVGADGTVRRWNLLGCVGKRSATPVELHRLLDVFSPVDGTVFWIVKGVVDQIGRQDSGHVFRNMSLIRGSDEPVAQMKWLLHPGVFAADGRHVAVYELTDAKRGSRVLAVPELGEVQSAAMHMPAFSRDGRRLVGSSGDGLLVVDAVAAGSAVVLEDAGDYIWPRFGPDGRHIIAIGRFVHARSRESMTARLWDSTTGRIVSTFTDAAEPLLAAVIDPGATLAAAVGADGSVKLFEVGTGRLLASMSGHRGKVYSVAFAPDGKRLASGGRDGSVRLWDVAERREVGQIAWSEDPVLAVAFSDDGEWVVSGTVGGAVVAEPVDPRAFVAARGLRSLTPAEQARFEIGGENEQAAYLVAWRQRMGLSPDSRR